MSSCDEKLGGKEYNCKYFLLPLMLPLSPGRHQAAVISEECISRGGGRAQGRYHTSVCPPAFRSPAPTPRQQPTSLARTRCSGEQEEHSPTGSQDKSPKCSFFDNHRSASKTPHPKARSASLRRSPGFSQLCLCARSTETSGMCTSSSKLVVNGQHRQGLAALLLQHTRAGSWCLAGPSA